jgi:hypothetical protein
VVLQPCVWGSVVIIVFIEDEPERDSLQEPMNEPLGSRSDEESVSDPADWLAFAVEST